MADSKQDPQFDIRSIYLKDLSFESPLPMIALAEDWNPDADIDLKVENNMVGDDGNNYEVVVRVKVSAKHDDKITFVTECEYGGLFMIDNFPEDQLDHMLRSYCANIIYPYVREAVSEVIARGGFPPLYLNPVNFDAIYAQEKEKEGNKSS